MLCHQMINRIKDSRNHLVYQKIGGRHAEYSKVSGSCGDVADEMVLHSPREPGQRGAHDDEFLDAFTIQSSGLHD